jgi:hypothetical protein
MRSAYGRLRYDRFLGKGFTVLWGVSAESNRFQGLLLRANLDAGFAYYFLDRRTQSLWTEATFDYQKDWRRVDAIGRAEAAGVHVSRSRGQYGGRLFGGYEGQLGSGLALATGLEYLQSMEESRAWRINWELCLSSEVRNGLSLAVVYDLRYDHAPLPTVLRMDGLLTANLVYRLR